MKYLILGIFLIFSLVYSGYYLYNFDKKKANLPRSKDSIIIPEHLTEEFWKSITPEQLKEKLKTIENINEVRSDNKQSMLHLLVLYGNHPEMIKILIDSGIDYTLIDKDGVESSFTALQYSLLGPEIISTDNRDSSLNEKMTIELLKYDIQVDQIGLIDNEEITALCLAIFMKAPVNIIKILLEKGANPNFKTNQQGLTPLTGEFVENPKNIQPRLEVVQLLIDYGAEIDITDTQSNKIYDYMKKYEKLTKTELFKKLSQQFKY